MVKNYNEAKETFQAHRIGMPLIAFVVTLVAREGLVFFSKLIIMFAFNVFSLPLVLTSEFSFPLWVWFIIGLYWFIYWVNLREKGKHEDDEGKLDEVMDSIEARKENNGEKE